jgi:Flp pilus assembly pilin Flp
MFKHIQRFMRDERGATSIEYAFVVAGLSLAIVTIAFRVAIK